MDGPERGNWVTTMNKGLVPVHREPLNIGRENLPALSLRKPPFAELPVLCPNILEDGAAV